MQQMAQRQQPAFTRPSFVPGEPYRRQETSRLAGKLLAIWLCGWLLSPLSSLTAADQVDGQVDYTKQIKPVFKERCFACHGVLKQEGGLRLDTAALAIKGGDSGAAIQPGDAQASLLLQRVSATDESERMPPEGEPLKAEQIAALKQWIAANALAPADEQPQLPPQEHWAFRAPVRPAVPVETEPAVEQGRWQRNPIDAFIAHSQRQHGLAPQPEADKRVWLRRVSLDLIGLPPTPAELDAFLADQSSDAYDKVVTRLLENPQYGPRWGRHWMDIWRYSDWWGLGKEVRNSQKHIWHWRDWIIESMNADKGYDQMLREMLAADELYPNDLDRLRATGYLARQYFIFNRTTWMDETIEHTAKAMLGLTFNCAKCHDHKYDPFSQVEYYRLRALFEPYQVRMEMIPGEIDFEKDGIPRVFDAHLDVPTYLHVRGDDLNPDKSQSLEPGVPAFLTSNDLPLAIEPVALPTEATHPGLREFVVDSHRQAAQQEIETAQVAVKTAQAKLVAAQTAAEKQTKQLADATAKAAAKNDTTSSDAASAEEDLAKVIVRDDFATPNVDVWEELSGQWTYECGRLVQSQTGASRAALRLKKRPPADFEARVKYIPTGGEKWKSVGISCDVTAEGNEVLAYVSAVAGGSKSQFAYRQNGNYVYPQGAAQSRKVELNQPHEMVLRVRGDLFNLSVDGEHSIAFQLPNGLQRQDGFLELIAFDAKVEFVEFELRPLPTDLKLVEATAGKKKTPASAASTLTVEQAQQAVAVAEKALQTTEAQLASIEARAAADKARYLNPTATAESADVDDAMSQAANAVALAASKSERVLAALKAEENVARAELVLLQAAADKKAAAEKELTAATTSLAAARKAVDTPSDAYTPLPGAKKTQEDYQNRNADKPFPTTSSGRRTALAQWLTNPKHPLPARVAVNHIWMRHMGAPLVPTVFDFGLNGTPPTHPELLDWLAIEFIENGWSMKHIHRLIVTSQAYRLTSSSAGAAAANHTADPENRYYWRMNPIRMEAQVVRDSLLYLAGELDVSLGGPSISVKDERARRRSVYFVHSHNDQHKFLSMFDDASVLDCYRRAESIVPQQALALENSPFVSSLAEKIAAKISAKVGMTSETEFVRTAFVTILSSEPTAEETSTMLELLGQMTELARNGKRPQPESFARINLVQTLLNHNDFITIR